MKNNSKNTLILLILMTSAICTIMYNRIEKNKKENEINIQENETNTNENEQINEQIIEKTKDLTDEDIKDIIIATYIKKNNEITNYRIKSVSLTSNTDELKEELKYEKTDILAYVKYDIQKNNEEEWIEQYQNCFILRQNEDGSYFVYKAGSGW